MLYWGKTFFQFIPLFFSRLLSFFQGGMQPDETQIVALVLISIMCSLLGVFLFVRKMAMVANAISHTVLVGIILAAICGHLFYGTQITLMEGGINPIILLGAGLITSFLTMALIEFLTNTNRVSKDMSIGLVFSFLFALGVILATIFTRNAHIGTEVIVGNIDLMTSSDLSIVAYLTLFVSAAIGLFYRPLLISSFDGQFATLSGISKRAITYLIVLLTSLTIIVAMRAVGIILILAFLIVPPLTARLFFSSMKSIIIASASIGATTSFLAVAISRHLLSVQGIAISTSGLVVAILFAFWVMGAFFAPMQGVFAKFLFRRKIDFSIKE